MDNKDLTTTQAKQIQARVSPAFRYLSKLKGRMEQRGFPEDDDLYRTVSKTLDAMQHLSVVLHYMTCTHGVGQPPREE
jgi:hypothetical protein